MHCSQAPSTNWDARFRRCWTWRYRLRFRWYQIAHEIVRIGREVQLITHITRGSTNKYTSSDRASAIINRLSVIVYPVCNQHSKTTTLGNAEKRHHLTPDDNLLSPKAGDRSSSQPDRDHTKWLN